MPLTIPLIDQVYSVSDISTDGNQIAIDTISQTFVIGVDTTLLDSGQIKIEESFFLIPATSPVSEEVSFNISSEGFEIPEFDIDPITLSSLVNSNEIGDCLPYALLGSYDETITLAEIPITEGLDNLSEYILSIDYVRIKSGELSLTVDNQFPFDIAMLEVSFNDENNQEWETLAVENVLAGTITSYPSTLAKLNRAYSAEPPLEKATL